MRIYPLILFVFIFCLVQNMVVEMELFPVGLPSNEGDGLASVGERMVDNMTAVSQDVTSEEGLNFGLIGFGFKLSGIILGAFTDLILIGAMLKSFGFPAAVANLLQAIMWFILGIGMFQLFTNRSMKSYE